MLAVEAFSIHLHIFSSQKPPLAASQFFRQFQRNGSGEGSQYRYENSSNFLLRNPVEAQVTFSDGAAGTSVGVLEKLQPTVPLPSRAPQIAPPTPPE